MGRLILVPFLIFIALAAIGGGVAYWIYNNYTYYSTDDAQVNGQIVNVSAPTSGMLTSLSVKQGDTVTAGQTLGSITPTPTAAPNGSQSSPSAINITSPMSGKVLQVSAVQGQGVAPGLSLITLTDLSSVNVIAYVDENALSNISVGQSVDIHIDAYGDTSFSGHVQQIVQAAASEFSLLPTQDNASGNFSKVGQRIPVIITLEGNGGKDIVPGMSAEVTIHIH
ncbi:MAG: HlyD family secretion protein [Chloroflexi bacterium]|nr:MAG: HlyD family secretion protein [Chloroflexota bacterium]